MNGKAWLGVLLVALGLAWWSTARAPIQPVPQAQPAPRNGASWEWFQRGSERARQRDLDERIKELERRQWNEDVHRSLR